MPLERSSKHSFRRAWTIATRYCTASLMAWCSGFRLSRTPSHNWSPEPGGATTSLQSFDSSIGSQSAYELTLSWPSLFSWPSSVLPGGRLSAGDWCRPSPTPFVWCVLHVCFNVPAPALAIGHSESPNHLFGTVSPLNSANLISLLDSSAER